MKPNRYSEIDSIRASRPFAIAGFRLFLLAFLLVVCGRNVFAECGDYVVSHKNSKTAEPTLSKNYQVGIAAELTSSIQGEIPCHGPNCRAKNPPNREVPISSPTTNHEPRETIFIEESCEASSELSIFSTDQLTRKSISHSLDCPERPPNSSLVH